MAIINLTPDSFYANSRCADLDTAMKRVDTVLSQGADMLDLGAYSTRPGAAEVSETEEWERLQPVLKAIRKKYPEVVISIDTFRSKVAEWSVDEGADIINDVSGGLLDNNMFKTVGKLQVPYILMHMRGTPATMQQFTSYNNLTADIITELSKAMQQLTTEGVHDVIIDPGFGFSKTLDQNYELFAHLTDFKIFEKPVLVGISRKSMIYKKFNITPEESLAGTTILNSFALEKGAAILRVHDVEEAVQAVEIYKSIYCRNDQQ